MSKASTDLDRRVHRVMYQINEELFDIPMELKIEFIRRLEMDIAEREDQINADRD